MSNKNQISRKSVNYLDLLKNLTKWFTNIKRTEDQLEELINKYKIENNVLKRILSYNYSFPYIIHYFNKYFNNIYLFDSLDTKILLKSISYIMDINNRNNSKYFMFLKSNELKDEVKDVIKNLIKKYFSTVYKIELQRRDLDIYYRLFKLGVIKDEDLLEIDKILNNDNPVIKSLDYINFQNITEVDEQKEIESEENLSESIVKFIENIKAKKFIREECQGCPLFKKPIVVLDTNAREIEPVDIAFIGLNPGVDEVKQDKPFVGDSGKYIRRIIDQIQPNKKWLIFNSILCHTSNKNEISDTELVMKNCLGLISEIFENFPARIFVPVGDDAKNLFEIKDKITQVSGKVFEKENDVKVIPLVHPSSILRNSKYQGIFDSSVKNILKEINTGNKVSTLKEEQINTNNLVDDVSNLLLVDVKRINNNKVLMILTDHAGNKKYHIKDFTFPILIKKKDWDQCNITTDKVDDNLIVNDYQRTQILKKCHQALKEMTDF